MSRAADQRDSTIDLTPSSMRGVEVDSTQLSTATAAGCDRYAAAAVNSVFSGVAASAARCSGMVAPWESALRTTM